LRSAANTRTGLEGEYCNAVGEIVRLSPQFCKVAATRQSVTGAPWLAGQIVPPDALIRIKRALLWADCAVNPAGGFVSVQCGGRMLDRHACE
jgi:hypothetical protein